MIRVAVSKDIDIINNIGNQYNNNFSVSYNVENYIVNNNFIVLVNEEDVVNGFLILQKSFETYNLEYIIVSKEERKKGIASKLLSYVIENVCTSGDNIMLEVSVDNIPAIALYKKFGFEEIAKREKYYNGIDALIMKRVI